MRLRKTLHHQLLHQHNVRCDSNHYCICMITNIIISIYLYRCAIHQQCLMWFTAPIINTTDYTKLPSSISCIIMLRARVPSLFHSPQLITLVVLFVLVPLSHYHRWCVHASTQLSCILTYAYATYTQHLCCHFRFCRYIIYCDLQPSCSSSRVPTSWKIQQRIISILVYN